jgi:hypothetical protein
MGGYDEFEDEPVFPVRIRRPVAPGASHGADPPVTPRANGGHTIPKPIGMCQRCDHARDRMGLA